MFNPDCRVFINSENSSNSFSARFGVSLSGRIGQTRALLSPGRCKRFVKDENGRFPTITCFGIESLGRFRSTQKPPAVAALDECPLCPFTKTQKPGDEHWTEKRRQKKSGKRGKTVKDNGEDPGNRPDGDEDEGDDYCVCRYDREDRSAKT